MGFNPFKSAEKKAKSAVNSVVDKVLKPQIRDAERTIDGFGNAIERRGKAVIKSVDDKADDIVVDAVRRVRQEVERAEDGLTERVPEIVTEKLPDLIEDGFEKLQEEAVKAAMKKALDSFLKVVAIAAPTRASMTFGMALSFVAEGEVGCTVTVPNPVAKITEIRKWAANPPNDLADIMQCIRDFGPESIAAGFKVCGNGPDFEWEGDDKYDRVEAFLSDQGVD